MQNTSVRQVLVITLVLNLSVAVGKIIIGLASGALAITADGFHSLIDGTSNVVGIIASTIAERPPDDDHPYGHGRFETLAALFIGGFLLLVAWEIVTGALERLGRGESPTLTPVAFVVLVVTLCINIGVSTYQIRRGKALKSELLLADAENTRADVFVTLSVLISMMIVSVTGWAWVDVVAALIVVALIGRAGWRILESTGRVLVDTAPYPPERLVNLIATLPAVQEVVRARSRGTVDAAHIDIDLRVSPAMTAAQTAAIADSVRARLEKTLSGVSEIEVHFLPESTDNVNPAQIARAAGDALGVATHEVVLIEDGARRVLEFHVEVPPMLTLHEAHDLATRLERDIYERMEGVAEIVTHIEPARNSTQTSIQLDLDEREALKADVLILLRARHPEANWHHLRVYTDADGLTLTMHAALAPSWTVQAAHQLAEDAETLLRAEMPQFGRVTIHTEPE